MIIGVEIPEAVCNPKANSFLGIFYVLLKTVSMTLETSLDNLNFQANATKRRLIIMDFRAILTRG